MPHAQVYTRARRLTPPRAPPHIHASSDREMIHTASLLHDDVLDMAETRRGAASVNVVFGNKRSVLAGRYHWRGQRGGLCAGLRARRRSYAW